MESILVSACLLGVSCRYDAKSKPNENVIGLMKKYNLIPVCPEILGGMATPRLPSERKGNKVVVISSSYMGSGDDELGAVLMKGFIYALSQQDELPKTILFYNGGAKLTCEEAPTLEDLMSLEANGVEILTCGTCLNHYGLTEKLKVGGVTNMYVITEKMMQADLIVKP